MDKFHVATHVALLVMLEQRDTDVQVPPFLDTEIFCLAHILFVEEYPGNIGTTAQEAVENRIAKSLQC